MKKELVAGCTIIAKNYLAQARVLAKSWKKYENAPFYVLITDQQEINKEEPFKTIRLRDLTVLSEKEVLDLTFKYTCVEFSTAIKPFFLEHLFTKEKITKLLFLDPDILITHTLNSIKKYFQNNDILLIPHITKQFPDEKNPSDKILLKTGTFNLGFIGIKKSRNTMKMLLWWQEKLRTYCYNREELFLDQKWANLILTIFEKVKIIKHPGCNVAYWNLHEREITLERNKYYVNKKPLIFFHFSGYDPKKPLHLSKYQNRYRLSKLGLSINKLFRAYKEELFKENYSKEIKNLYTYNYFENGKYIFEKDRELFTKVEKEPFHTKKNSFYRYNRGFNGKILQTYLKAKKLFFKIGYWFINGFLINAVRPEIIIWVKDILKATLFYEHISKEINHKKPELGVNLLGYFTTESGMGESARTLVRAFMQIDIPLTLNNSEATTSRKKDEELKKYFSKENPYNINIIIVNGDQFKQVISTKGKSYIYNRYNIAYWTWELEKIPGSWKSQLNIIDELWVPSNYVKKAIEKITNKKILVIPHNITTKEIGPIKIRKKLRITKKAFMFLFIFDFFSYIERKNPFAIIRAFKEAFKEEDVTLVIKCTNSKFNERAFKELKKQGRKSNIIIFDKYLAKKEVEALINSCDCYVSLHRSEGFGFTLAEAMIRGKPVIHTNYSGNKDFATEENSYPVTFKKIKLERDVGPYKKGNMWAEPNIQDAIKRMIYVYYNQEKAQKKGQKAKKTIEQQYSPQHIKKVIDKRITQLMNEIK